MISMEGLNLPISTYYKATVIKSASIWSVESSSCTIFKAICAGGKTIMSHLQIQYVWYVEIK